MPGGGIQDKRFVGLDVDRTRDVIDGQGYVKEGH
jgi:hypothetical protein